MVQEKRTEVEAGVARLFQLPLSEFVQARNALAKELRGQKRKPEADRIKALTKPSIGAWVVNQLHWHYRAEFDAMTNAGSQLRDLQASSSAARPDLTQASRKLQYTLDRLLDIAQRVLQEAGHSVNPVVLRKVATTLETAANFGDLPGDQELGFLTQELAASGFDALLAVVPEPTPRSRSGPEKKGSETPPKPISEAPPPAEPSRTGELKRRHSAVRRALEDAAKELQRLQRESERKAANVERIKERLESAQADLEGARSAHAEKKEEVDALGSELHLLENEISRARKASPPSS